MTWRIHRRSFLGHSALALGAIAGGGLSAGRARAAAGTLRCGVVTSLSGPYIFGGNLTRRGYDFWAETVNQQGGIEIAGERYEVEMLYGDAQSQPAVGADAAERLIVQEEVAVLFGPYSSGVTLAVQPICNKYRVPMISGSAESPNVWRAQPEFNFGMIPSVDLSAGKSIRVLAEQAAQKPESAVVIGADEAFSKETSEGFRQGVEDLGMELLDYSLVPPAADLTPVVSKLSAQQPDVVAVGAHEELLINFIKTAKSLNYRPKALLMHYGVTNPAFVQELGADADGVLGISVWSPDLPYEGELFGTAQDYSDAAYNRWGSRPDYTEAACSASGLVLQNALGQLGKAPPYSQEDRAALNEAIAATDIMTFYGPVKFEQSGDHYHDNTQPVPVLIQIQNGEAVTVGPQDAARAELTYPLPAWS